MERSIRYACFAALTAASTAGGTSSLQAQTIIGLEASGTLVEIDGSTGQGTALVTLQSGFANAMARGPQGELWVLDSQPLGFGELYEVDLQTGGVLSLGSFADSSGARGLARDPSTGHLYFTKYLTPFGVPDELWMIDLTQGAAQLVGSVDGFKAIQGLTFTPDGTLYGWAVQLPGGLIEIDPATGDAVDIGLQSGEPGLQFLASDDVGRLYGGRHELYSIDRTTGQAHWIGGGGYNDLRGGEVVLAESVSTYCTAQTNSLGCLPTIASTGTPSASGVGAFTITAQDLLNNRAGLLYYGFGEAALPFGGGWLCVQPPIARTPVTLSGGNPPPLDCSGGFQFDMNAWIASGVDPALAAGNIDVFAQFWSRDPGSPSTTNLTDALRFYVGN